MVYYKNDFNLYIFFCILIISTLVYITIIDLKTKTISDKSNLLILVLAILLRSFICFKYKSLSPIIDSFIGLAIGAIPLSIIAITTNGAIGGGDIKLFSVLGFFLGVKYILLCVIITFIIAGVFSSIMIITKKMNKKSSLALAPFICLAFVIVIVFYKYLDMFLWIGGAL